MRRSRRAGFTLIEVAVAMAILGVGVVTLQQIYQGALRLQDRASRQTRAVLHARGMMDALLVKRDAKDQSFEETTREGFRTRVLVRDAPVDEGGEPKDGDLGFESDHLLKYVQVEVAWSDGAGMKTYTLRSLRLASEAEE